MKKLLCLSAVWMAVLLMASSGIVGASAQETGAPAVSTAAFEPVSTPQPESIEPASEAESAVNPYLHPRLYVSEYDIIEGRAAQGSAFTLAMQIANTSEIADACNIMVTITLNDGGLFLHEGNTNQFYIERIAAGGSHEIQLPLHVVEGNQAAAAVISVSFQYYNESGLVFDNQTMLSPALENEYILQIQSVVLPERAYAGSQIPIAAACYNQYATPLENVTMVVESDGVEIGRLPVGTMEYGESKTVEGTLSFPEAGQPSLRVYFTYQDRQGKGYATEAKEYTLHIENMPSAADQTELADDEILEFAGLRIRKRTAQIAAGIIIAIAVISLAVTIIYVIKKRSE